MTEDFDIAKAFGATVGFNQRFSVYVPNKDRNGNSVDQSKWVDRILRLLSEICGGATSFPPLTGAWLNKGTGQLIVEEPVLIYAFVEPKEFIARIKDLADLIRRMGLETNQGQVAFEFDSVLYLIDFPKGESP